ncbi:hypothetical protein LTR06_011244 [Exophiala xenobiotica]|nr:hypothetical protein LTR06_011244 [Exophiala xenobiotica]
MKPKRAPDVIARGQIYANVGLHMVGALAEPLAVAWHCIRISGFQAGQKALILGAGPIGLAILLLLKLWGAEKTIITEVTEERIRQARMFEADMVINPIASIGATVNPVLAGVAELTRDGVDVAFDCTDLQSTLDTALQAVKPGGTVFNVAIHDKPPALNLNDIAVLEKRLLGGICYTAEDFEAVIAAMASGAIPFEKMVTAVVPLNEVVEGGFQALIKNKAQQVKILIQPNTA